jgi:hypothetical protein
VGRGAGKTTGLPPHYRWEMGLVRVVMGDGKFRITVRKDDDNALLQHLAQRDRGVRETGPGD